MLAAHAQHCSQTPPGCHGLPLTVIFRTGRFWNAPEFSQNERSAPAFRPRSAPVLRLKTEPLGGTAPDGAGSPGQPSPARQRRRTGRLNSCRLAESLSADGALAVPAGPTGRWHGSRLRCSHHWLHTASTSRLSLVRGRALNHRINHSHL